MITLMCVLIAAAVSETVPRRRRAQRNRTFVLTLIGCVVIHAIGLGIYTGEITVTPKGIIIGIGLTAAAYCALKCLASIPVKGGGK